MKNTSDRIKFISEYLASYETNINQLNSVGLFDAAKHFELFAQEVCRLWYGQKFKNLNYNIATYPYVDLVSEDNAIFVQVSTTNTLTTKIRNTLKSIISSTSPEYTAIKNVKFFMLKNPTRLNDITEGRLKFNKDQDLITVKSVLNRANNDPDFQNALFELLQKDVALKEEFKKSKEAIKKSKFDISRIIGLINDEYEINRGEIVNNVIKTNAKNSVVLGLAGYGKSVVCKKVVSDCENVLFTRAELIASKTNINDLWNFNIIDVLNATSKPITIFIDSLEFIADSLDKNNLLPYLFEITKNMSNVKILMSCRTSDYDAFIKLKGSYFIEPFEVHEISDSELLQISNKYEIIKTLSSQHEFVQLLKCPLYIDLLVTKIKDTKNINNENEFRKYIWDKIICLDDNGCKEIIKKIVFERAKKFLTYVCADDFDNIKLKRLISKNILIQNENSFVRLKYDIFEDICFERYFDEKFNNCCGNFSDFFSNISNIGRCAYRRYQIWVSNKLLCNVDRNSVLNKIIFSDKTPNEWKKQTMVGLIRSRFSDDFFNENADEIIKNNLLDHFIHLANLYGFIIDNGFISKISPLIVLTPFGQGRIELIKIIHGKELYKSRDSLSNDLLKLINDYTRIPIRNRLEKVSKMVVDILKFHVDKCVDIVMKPSDVNTWAQNEYLIKLLKPLYALSELAVEWIKVFWGNITKVYQGKSWHHANKIIEFTLSADNCLLAISMPKELCELAEMYWTYERPKPRHDFYGGRSELHSEAKFGLSSEAEHFSNYHDSPMMSGFFQALFNHHKSFLIGFEWAIEFINKCMMAFKKSSPDCCTEYEINFVDKEHKKTYYANPYFWIAAVTEGHLPRLISDMIYCLQSACLNHIKSLFEFKNENTANIANSIRNKIYEKSNNILLFPIILAIGLNFQKELPGYALDLASSLDIVHDDVDRLVLTMKNPLIESLEQQMCATVGIPNLGKRYKRLINSDDDLRKYVLHAQIYYSDEVKEKCYKILDYLYSITPNDEENATDYLQIQNMDSRGATITRYKDGTLVLEPKITGNARKVAETQTQKDKPASTLVVKLNSLISAQNKIPEFQKSLEIIEEILSIKERSIRLMFNKALVTLIYAVLNNDTLSSELREKYTGMIWDSAKSLLMNNNYLQLEANDFLFLFAQLDFNISEELKKRIKRLILNCVTFEGQNGMMLDVKKVAIKYLSAKSEVSRLVFNTITKLAEDKMNHQKFNADYVLKSGKEKDFMFTPNTTLDLIGVDSWIEDAKSKGKKENSYKSKEESIIQDYLFKGKKLDLSKFDIDNFHIRYICMAISCGIDINNKEIQVIVKQVIKTMIRIWDDVKQNSHDILGFFPVKDVKDTLSHNLIKDDISASNTLDILFDNIDFQNSFHKTTEFYHDILQIITIHYFFAHNDIKHRKFCVDVFEKLEKKISLINNNGVKWQLEKVLAFYFSNHLYRSLNKCEAGYSFNDKKYMNSQIGKFGGSDMESLLISIRQLHMEKLLPEILLAVNSVMIKANTNKHNWLDSPRGDGYTKESILLLITKAFIDFGDAIKKDAELTEAFESILNILCEENMEEAAVTLDEFRIH